jgi:ATP-dependent Clp endopeptidase proteolytic subunit ClpP
MSRPRAINLAALGSGQRHTRPVNRAQDVRGRDWYRITAAADGSVAEVHLYDDIGYFGTSAAQFVDELGAVDAPQVNVRINSSGGEVYDGIAIYNAIRNHPSTVTTYVDGLAASIASLILQAGDVRIAQRASQVMIHDPLCGCVGNQADMLEAAAMLDKAANMMAQVYADRAGGSPEVWRAAMRAETWYDSGEAETAGLVNTVAGAPVAADATARFDLSVFNYAGRAAAPPPPLLKYDPAEMTAIIRERVALARQQQEGK